MGKRIGLIGRSGEPYLLSIYGVGFLCESTRSPGWQRGFDSFIGRGYEVSPSPILDGHLQQSALKHNAQF
jgi:hypothetical protein